MGSFRKNVPDADEAAMTDILKDVVVAYGLANLMGAIDDNGAPEVSWSYPSIALRIPATIDQVDPDTPDTALTAAQRAYAHKVFDALDRVTHGVVRFEGPDGALPIMPVDRVKALNRETNTRRNPETGQLSGTPGDIEKRVRLEAELFSPAGYGYHEAGLSVRQHAPLFEIKHKQITITVAACFWPKTYEMQTRESYYRVAVALVAPVVLSSWSASDQHEIRCKLAACLPPLVDGIATVDHDEPITPQNPPTRLRSIPRDIPVQTGAAIVDSRSVVLIGYLSRLPKKKEAVSHWADLEANEIARLKLEHGEGAYEKHIHFDLDTKRDELTPRAAKELMVTATIGGKWVRQWKKPYGEKELSEWLVTIDQVTGSTIGFSYQGRADVLIPEDQAKLSTQVKELLQERIKSREDEQSDLKTGLFSSDKALIKDADESAEREINQIEVFDVFVDTAPDALAIMHHIIKQASMVRPAPLRISAAELHGVLPPTKKKRNRDRIEAALNALRLLRIDVQGEDAPGDMHFLSRLAFRKDKDTQAKDRYEMEVTDALMGCVAKTTGPKDPLPKGAQYDRATAEGELWLSAKNATDSQKNLHRFIEDYLTPRSAKAASFPTDGKWQWIKPTKGQVLREYDRRFCPELPDGKSYYAALGSFDINPEAGFTIAGRDGNGGLLKQMKIAAPQKGKVTKKHGTIFRKAVDDICAVVDRLQGVTMARYNKAWITPETAKMLAPSKLGKEVTWFLFISTDYLAIMKSDIEAKNPRLLLSENSDGTGLQLCDKLRAARLKADKTQAEVAAWLGVTRQVYDRWEKGTKPVPSARRAKIDRWISENP